MKRNFWVKVVASAVMGALSLSPLHGDMALPVTHYKAMPLAQWRQAQGLDPVPANDKQTRSNPVNTDNAETGNWGVVCALIVVAITGMAVINVSIKDRKDRLMSNFLLIGLTATCCLCVWIVSHYGRKYVSGSLGKRASPMESPSHPPEHVSERDYLERVKEVPPETSESYEEYLQRVDRLERRICLKCDTQMAHRLYSWHCPKCEPDYFVCEKCGGVKAEAYYRGRYLYCTKCGEGRQGPADDGP